MDNIWTELIGKRKNFKWYERIKFLRRFNNWSIKEVAEKCITTEKAWWSWENGLVTPTSRNKKVIASIFDMDEKIIFGEISSFS